jgi:hypothetical protein
MLALGKSRCYMAVSATKNYGAYLLQITSVGGWRAAAWISDSPAAPCRSVRIQRRRHDASSKSGPKTSCFSTAFWAISITRVLLTTPLPVEADSLAVLPVDAMPSKRLGCPKYYGAQSGLYLQKH